MSKKRIINILKDLGDTDPMISVTVSDKEGTIHIRHEREKGIDFIFQWFGKVGHYVGKFIDSKGRQSQSVVTLKKPIHAIYFVAAYRLLDDIRAMQRHVTTGAKS